MCTIYTIYRAWQCTTLKQVEPKREAFNDPSAEEALAQYILYILVIEYQMPTSSWRSTQKTQKKKKNLLQKLLSNKSNYTSCWTSHRSEHISRDSTYFEPTRRPTVSNKSDARFCSSYLPNLTRA